MAEKDKNNENSQVTDNAFSVNRTVIKWIERLLLKQLDTSSISRQFKPKSIKIGISQLSLLDVQH